MPGKSGATAALHAAPFPSVRGWADRGRNRATLAFGRSRFGRPRSGGSSGLDISQCTRGTAREWTRLESLTPDPPDPGRRETWAHFVRTQVPTVDVLWNHRTRKSRSMTSNRDRPTPSR
jgi:hypothetical protein